MHVLQIYERLTNSNIITFTGGGAGRGGRGGRGRGGKGQGKETDQAAPPKSEE